MAVSSIIGITVEALRCDDLAGYCAHLLFSLILARSHVGKDGKGYSIENGFFVDRAGNGTIGTWLDQRRGTSRSGMAQWVLQKGR